MNYRAVLIILMLFATGYAKEINRKWETNENCRACHMDIVDKWEGSRHANSHFNKNDLYKKSLEYIVRNNPKIILDEAKVECSACHNPRISKTKVEDVDKYLLLMDIEENKKQIQQTLNTKNMQNGINCVVCHNVDEIHLDKKKGSQGLFDIQFGEQGTMFGPFDDANSPYHKTVQRSHFVDQDPKLCFACHYGSSNKHGVEVYATGKEYESVGSNEGCLDCHMSKKYQGYASNFVKDKDKPKPRMIREHRFASVDNSNIVLDYIDTTAKVNGEKFVITIANNTPHRFPTGYGLRRVLLDVKYFDSKDKMIKSFNYTLGSQWIDAKGNKTIPALATQMSKDTRVTPHSKADYAFKIPNGATYVVYQFSYRFVDEALAKEMGVSDSFFLNPYVFLTQRVHLK